MVCRWYTPVIPAFWSVGQEFKVKLQFHSGLAWTTWEYTLLTVLWFGWTPMQTDQGVYLPTALSAIAGGFSGLYCVFCFWKTAYWIVWLLLKEASFREDGRWAFGQPQAPLAIETGAPSPFWSCAFHWKPLHLGMAQKPLSGLGVWHRLVCYKGSKQFRWETHHPGHGFPALCNSMVLRICTLLS